MKSSTSILLRNFGMALIAIIFVSSCKKEKQPETQDLKFQLESYYVTSGNEISIDIQTGNNRYSIQSPDDNNFVVDINEDAWPSGNIHIKGLNKGHSTLIIRDEITGQKKELNIHVVAPYLTMRAIGLISGVLGAPYGKDNAIRKEVKEGAAYNVDFFGKDELLVLQGGNFLVFGNENDLANGEVLTSGSYRISFEGELGHLLLSYGDNKRTVDFRIPEGTSSYSILKNFSNGILAGPKDFNPQNPYPHLYLSKDFTADFQKAYPEIERVDLTEEMYLYPYFHHLKIAQGILD
ncbi:hypothetical protein K2F45_00320 [Sphingobacterium siyangense]|uniref:hypothetical protein n=1 Tax=Sphingobacterium siyangense TaxID=459529 RepID=UPI00200E803D|nr:hypothetical protein [Sphingobacterium siyangense]UQA75493.1 hypothetical protein K2F45_00320 [Sphingobacterium siyangense]